MASKKVTQAMSILVIIVHTVVAIALILIVLLQTGKGADMGAAFGGGSSQTLFGSTGASTFLSRLTTIAAIVFMLTSLSLAYLSGRGGMRSIVSEVPAPATQSAEEAVPGTPAQEGAGEAMPEAPLQTEQAAPEQQAGTSEEAAPASESAPADQGASTGDEAAKPEEG
jgi:preprotein translocase subunit SecG